MVSPKLTTICLLLSLVGFARPAFALFHTTAKDLQVLEDDLKTRLEENERLRGAITPLLLAPPKHVWRESRDDFGPAVKEVLTRVLGEGQVIDCQSCDTHRMHVAESEQLVIQNGELGPIDFQVLGNQPQFADAKAMAIVRETASGVEMRVMSVRDGRILYMVLADSQQTIGATNPYLHYATELDRRKMGEALAYTFINIGLYPEGLFQVEWVEQFGARNQHIAGIGISLFNPIFAIGGVYHYMLPGHPQASVAGAVYYPLQNALGDFGDTGGSGVTSEFVLQGMASYAFTDTFGVFVSISSEGVFSGGIHLFNPLLLPFML